MTDYMPKPNASNDERRLTQLQMAEAAGFHFHKNEENGIHYTNALQYSEHCVYRLIDRIDASHNREKDAVYRERNILVALLAGMFPSGVKRTPIEGWDPEWTNCCYIDFPWGQASWHFHDSDSHLFAHLPVYTGEWDGHTTEEKYTAIKKNLCTIAN